MSFTERIAAGRAFARPNDPPSNANRGLVATGAADLGGALLGAMPGGRGTSQTTVVRSAVVIVYSVGLIRPMEFRAIRGVRRMEFRWALIACAGVLVFGTLKGILVAIIVSMMGLANHTAQPRVSVIGRKCGADLGYPALQMLMEGEKRWAEASAEVWLAGLNPRVLEVTRHVGLDQKLGRERTLFNARAAIERYQARGAGAGNLSRES